MVRVFTPFVLASAGLFSAAAASPHHLAHKRSGHAHSEAHARIARSGGTSDSYVVYGGDGSSNAGWPTESDWSSFEDLWSANEGIMKQSCSAFDVADNSDGEMKAIHDSIKSIGQISNVDPRFILAIMLQESNGCVRVHTTSYSVSNPGLMQSHSGKGTCNVGNKIMNPCPETEIKQMIKDGTDGTSSGPGLKHLLSKAASHLKRSGAEDAQGFYRAARMYNSGSVASSGNLGQGVATHCYASDVANRLTGWVKAKKTCEEGSIGQLNHAEGSKHYQGSGGDGSSSSGSASASVPVSAASSSAPVTFATSFASSSIEASTSAPAGLPTIGLPHFTLPGDPFHEIRPTTGPSSSSVTPASVSSSAASSLVTAAASAVSSPTAPVFSAQPTTLAAAPSPASVPTSASSPTDPAASTPADSASPNPIESSTPTASESIPAVPTLPYTIPGSGISGIGAGLGAGVGAVSSPPTPSVWNTAGGGAGFGAGLGARADGDGESSPSEDGAQPTQAPTPAIRPRASVDYPVARRGVAINFGRVRPLQELKN